MVFSLTSQCKQGWLTKQGGRMKNWRRRWFAIRDTQLVYYKDAAVGALHVASHPKDLRPLGVITLVLPLDVEGRRIREVGYYRRV